MDTQAVSETTSLPHSLSLYVHIPFCETKCPYCDFNTYAGIEHMMPAYVEALDRGDRELGPTSSAGPP